MRIPVLASCLLLACAGLAQADVIILKHGGKIQGTVVKKTKRKVVVRIKGGGTMSLPLSTVKRVESRESAESKYAERVANVNFNDPNSIDQLALWSSLHGLGDKAKELESMAHGLRLEVMIARAKRQRRAQAYVDIFYWARSVGLSDEVQQWVLREARALDPEDVALKGAEERLRRAAREEAKAAARRAEFNGRPRYRMPSGHAPASAPPTAAQMRSVIATERTRLRSRKPPRNPAQTKVWLERARQARKREAEVALGHRNARREAQRAASRPAEGDESR